MMALPIAGVLPRGYYRVSRKEGSPNWKTARGMLQGLRVFPMADMLPRVMVTAYIISHGHGTGTIYGAYSLRAGLRLLLG